MIVNITRFVFVTAGALGGFGTSRLIDWSDQIGFPEYLVILIFIILGWSIGYVVGGIVGREVALQYQRLEERMRDLSASDLVLGTVGLLVGLVIAWLGSLPLRLIEPQVLAITSTVLLFVMSAYSGVRIALVKRVEFASAFPDLDASPGRQGSPPCKMKLLDTSAVIDGRFVELHALGVLEGDVRVPRFVLSELQTLADSADDMKRSRGRRGLDLLARLQDSPGAADVFETDYPEIADTDGKLMRLAAETNSVLVTVDYNMSRVAEVRGIGYLNLNDIASALRPAFLPGESLRLRVAKEGKESDQGVGYLEDGTMVVIQDGRDHIGVQVDTEVTSVLQTSAGRMIFARFTREADADLGGIGPTVEEPVPNGGTLPR